MSIGVITDDGSSDAGTVLRDADATASLAKARGRGRIEVFDHRVHDQVVTRLATELELRHGLDDDQLVLAGLKAGAKGYLLKDVSLEQLVEAVRTVAEGGSLVAPAVTQRLLAGVDRIQNQFTSLEQPDPLTGRETEILRLLAGGYSNKEIANSLHVAEGTVKNHVSNILSKLGVRDRTRAVLKALELGIV